MPASRYAWTDERGFDDRRGNWVRCVAIKRAGQDKSASATLFLVYGAIGLIATLITKETFGPTERAAANQNDESMRVDA